MKISFNPIQSIDKAMRLLSKNDVELSEQFKDSFDPIINIGLKSIVVGIIYVLIVYRFNFSEDITTILDKFINRS